MSCSYQDIEITAAKMAKISQCSVWGTGNLKRIKIECTIYNSMKIGNTMSSSYLLKIGYHRNQIVKTTNKLKILGIEHRTTYFLAIDNGSLNKFDQIQFGRVQDIVIYNVDNVYFLCDVCPTKYHANLDAYDILSSQM